LQRYAEFASTRPSCGTCLRAPSLHVRRDKQQRPPGASAELHNIKNPLIRKLANSTAPENPQSDSTSTSGPNSSTVLLATRPGIRPLRRRPHPHCPNLSRLLFAMAFELRRPPLASHGLAPMQTIFGPRNPRGQSDRHMNHPVGTNARRQGGEIAGLNNSRCSSVQLVTVRPLRTALRLIVWPAMIVARVVSAVNNGRLRSVQYRLALPSTRIMME